MIELGKFCFTKTKLEQIYRNSVNQRLSLTNSAPNFAKNICDKKMHISANSAQDNFAI